MKIKEIKRKGMTAPRCGGGECLLSIKREGIARGRDIGRVQGKHGQTEPMRGCLGQGASIAKMAESYRGQRSWGRKPSPIPGLERSR